VKVAEAVQRVTGSRVGAGRASCAVQLVSARATTSSAFIANSITRPSLLSVAHTWPLLSHPLGNGRLSDVFVVAALDGGRSLPPRRAALRRRAYDPGVGHLLHLQDPAPVAAVVADFLQRNPMGTSRNPTG
jgi:pimeloyl-ACP methyl ester carboxylesterase